LQAVQRTEGNRLVKVTRWHVEKLVVAERTGRNKISFIAKQTCDVVAHLSRPGVVRRAHSDFFKQTVPARFKR
jgi:hypothetical protein